LALAALEWLLTIPRAIYLRLGKTGMELAAQHHAKNPKIGKIVPWVGQLAPGLGDNQAPAIPPAKRMANQERENHERRAEGTVFEESRRDSLRKPRPLKA
jgi:hypothetical protein